MFWMDQPKDQEDLLSSTSSLLMTLRKLEMLSMEQRLLDSRSELTSALLRTLTNPHLESTSTMARQHDLASDCETPGVEEVVDLLEVVETDTTREIVTMKTETDMRETEDLLHPTMTEVSADEKYFMIFKIILQGMTSMIETILHREEMIATTRTGIVTERGRGTMKTDTEMTGTERTDIARTGTETLTEAMTDLLHPETTTRETGDMIEDTPAVVETGMEDIPAPPAEDLLLLDLLHAEITEVHFVHGGENYTHYFDKLTSQLILHFSSFDPVENFLTF